MSYKFFKSENYGYFMIYIIGFINWYLFFNFGEYGFDFEHVGPPDWVSGSANFGVLARCSQKI